MPYANYTNFSNAMESFSGLQQGFIQVVVNARTVASIQKEFGGVIRGSFKDEVLKKWLEDKNPVASDMQEAINRFMLSCAGYCVATYVLGKVFFLFDVTSVRYAMEMAGVFVSIGVVMAHW